MREYQHPRGERRRCCVCLEAVLSSTGRVDV
jgi:hypothetical protein